MSIRNYLDLSIRRRLPLERELSPCFKPRVFATYRHFTSGDRRLAFPQSVFVNWFWWQTRIDVVTARQADLPQDKTSQWHQ